MEEPGRLGLHGIPGCDRVTGCVGFIVLFFDFVSHAFGRIRRRNADAHIAYVLVRDFVILVLQVAPDNFLRVAFKASGGLLVGIVNAVFFHMRGF